MSSWPKFMVLIVYILSSVGAAERATYKLLNAYEECRSGTKNVRQHDSKLSYRVILENESKPLDCHYEFEMYNKNFRKNYGFHVYFEDLQLINGDYIQFGRDSGIIGFPTYESQHYSGNKSNLSYLEMEDFEFDLWIKIKNTSYKPKLNLTITIVKKNCNKDEGRWRNCPNHNFCVHKDFFCDGYHNCPKSMDEMGNQCIDQEKPGKMNFFSIIGVLMGICLVILAIYFLTPLMVLHCKKRSNQSQNQNVQENELQDFNQVQNVSSNNHQMVSEDKPPDYEERPPAYEDLFNKA